MKKKASLFLRIAVSLALIAVLYRKVDLHELHDVFARLRPLWLLPYFIILFANTGLSALKWRWLLLADGIDIPWRKLTANYLISYFFSMFLPSSIGGDAYRVIAVARHSKRTANTFASVLADRVSGFIALVLLGLACCLAGYKLNELPDTRIILIPIGALVLLVIALGVLIQQKFARWMLALKIFGRLPKLRDFGLGVLDSAAQYHQSPGLYVRIMTVSFIFQSAITFCIWMLAQALNLPLRAIYVFMFAPLITLLEALPISIFGIGWRDNLYFVFYSHHAGLTREQSAAYAMLFVLTAVLYSATGGILFAFRRGNLPADG